VQNVVFLFCVYGPGRAGPGRAGLQLRRAGQGWNDVGRREISAVQSSISYGCRRIEIILFQGRIEAPCFRSVVRLLGVTIALIRTVYNILGDLTDLWAVLWASGFVARSSLLPQLNFRLSENCQKSFCCRKCFVEKHNLRLKTPFEKNCKQN